MNLVFIFSFFKKFKGKILYFSPEVFNPQFFVVSTSFFAQHLYIPNDATVLDMGTGSGVLGILAAQRAKSVTATDINPYAIRNAIINVKINKLQTKIKLKRGNLFRPITEKFDVILFNPPYYPVKPKTYLEMAWCCGENYQIIRAFLSQAGKYLTERGFIQISVSSYMDLNFIKKLFKKYRLQPIVVARKFLLFEILYIYLLRPEYRG
ncbi:MAG: HemK2/MTQ2 family protein methyltransferase [Candidatus Helarchaeota archaeon]